MAIKRKSIKPAAVKPAAKTTKSTVKANVKVAKAADAVKPTAKEAVEPRLSAVLMRAITDKLNEGFSFADITKAVKLTGKTPRPRKDESGDDEAGHSFSTTSSSKKPKKAAQFERPGREFPVSLRKLGTLSDHKDSFRESLTKVPKEFGVRMTHFNKLVRGDETGLVIDLKRRSGVWCFVALNEKNKRIYVPVETVIG